MHFPGATCRHEQGLRLACFLYLLVSPAELFAADVAPRAAYEGQHIVNIRFEPPAQPVTSEDLNGLLKWKAGDVLTLNDVRSTIKRLYATGSYSSIDVETEPATGGVELVIRTTEQWFIGPVEARGKVNLPPSEGQLADASRLELGQPFGDDDLDRAMNGIARIARAKRPLQRGSYSARSSAIPFTRKYRLRFRSMRESAPVLPCPR